MTLPPSDIKAVLWDFGGVLTTSPFDAFAEYERANGLPVGFIRTLNATNSDANAWAAFERSDVDVDGFAHLFEAEARAAGGEVDARALIALISGALRPEMVEALRRCHERLKTGLLTNNFVPTEMRAADTGYGPVLHHFDVVVESSKAGCRKPDPRFYEMALTELGIEPANAVFVDDLGVNLKPAREMGMTTIKFVSPGQALADLEAAVGFALSD